MIKKYLLAFCCICGMAGTSAAQENIDSNAVPQKYVKLRINPLALFELDAGIMIGGELQLNEKFSVGLDLAYLFMGYNSRIYNSFNGYKIRPEFRYYFSRRKKTNWFLAAEATYKRTIAGSVSDQCAGGPGCPFLQQQRNTLIRSVPGGSFKFGMLAYMGKKKRSYFECYLGIGFKVVNEYTKGRKNEPDRNNTPFSWEESFYFGEGPAPNLPTGIRFGIRL